MGVWIETTVCSPSIAYMKSLPAWECGLKPTCRGFSLPVTESLPAWECGLKHADGKQTSAHLLSLPAWECGLKHQRLAGFQALLDVTPRVGVWIETDIPGT